MSYILKVLNELYVPGEKLCISPRGLYTILMNLMIGCKKDTRDKVKDILGIFGGYIPISETPEFRIEPCDNSNELINESVMLIEKGYPIKKDFINSSMDIFSTKVIHFTEDSDEVIEKVRKWILLSTRGLIKDIELSLNENTRLEIINVVYFKFKWRYPFDADITSRMPFNKYDGSKVMIDTMIMYNTSYYYKRDEDMKSQIVMLEYDDYRFAMFIVIPDTATGIDNIVSFLKDDVNMINRITMKKDMNFKEINLYLPKFEMENDVDMSEALINMGCGDLFKNGELVGISDVKTLRVSGIKQKTVIKVDEIGTEAASVTDTCVADGPSNCIEVSANVPFMYIVADLQTKIPLFVGVFQG
ncbi:SWPV2-ORF018 [Shearwaterpox virus]|uniref:SWPV2-ORF018 n=1 Tax=Shearwaterpox virus TaxID=1974596 RepID=A0A1V0QFX9_CNPV|nr:SWPV2-ORF018 [Shearwaterpox virus]QRM15651.1 putative serpin [Penguinpox virus 2]QRM15981.1 putative serpin [Albatrosspox virus]